MRYDGTVSSDVRATLLKMDATPESADAAAAAITREDWTAAVAALTAGGMTPGRATSCVSHFKPLPPTPAAPPTPASPAPDHALTPRPVAGPALRASGFGELARSAVAVNAYGSLSQCDRVRDLDAERLKALKADAAAELEEQRRAPNMRAPRYIVTGPTAAAMGGIAQRPKGPVFGRIVSSIGESIQLESPYMLATTGGILRYNELRCFDLVLDAAAREHGSARKADGAFRVEPLGMAELLDVDVHTVQRALGGVGSVVHVSADTTTLTKLAAMPLVHPPGRAPRPIPERQRGGVRGESRSIVRGQLGPDLTNELRKFRGPLPRGAGRALLRAPEPIYRLARALICELRIRHRRRWPFRIALDCLADNAGLEARLVVRYLADVAGFNVSAQRDGRTIVFSPGPMKVKGWPRLT